eukprot:GAHX01001744.1.p1 GENE.GAHX01001744.1~~GAHX01001744.1.p1  ORF type:complete len:284 (-),score=49.58 GAHX01001744.1:461-1312(-)
MTNENKEATSISNGNFHCCYLLKSLKSSNKTINYIGYTNNPIKRLSQHNGLIIGGAKKTTKHRPWEMLFFVEGFINEVMGLQFEWAWQHPNKTKYLKGQPSTPNSNGLHRHLRECISLINSPPFCAYKLKLVFLNYALYERFTIITENEFGKAEQNISFKYLTEEDGKNLDFNIKKKLQLSNTCNIENKVCGICKTLKGTFETTKSVLLNCNKCCKTYHLLCVYYKINKQIKDKDIEDLSVIPKVFICANVECGHEEDWYSFIKQQKEMVSIKKDNLNISFSL